MKITVLTLFPGMIRSFLNESIVFSRAQQKNLVEIDIVNLRDFATDAYGTVDDRPYGGGAGMVLKVDIMHNAIRNTKHKARNAKFKERVILTSPRGRKYDQSIAKKYAALDHLILIAGHYEGVDERTGSYIDEEVSLGDFVMTGGEIAAAAIIDSVVRLIPGALKKDEAIQDESFFEVDINVLIKAVGAHKALTNLQKKHVKVIKLLEYPHYTRPEKYEGMDVPAVLLSGNHAEIATWRLQRAFEETLKRRSDLLLSDSGVYNKQIPFIMIILDAISKQFGTKRALEDISLRVEEGEVVGFLGPNGAGKTTTMRTIVGYLRPSSGSVRIDGKDPIANRMHVLHMIGYLPENNPLYPEMTVEEYLQFIIDVKGGDGAAVHDIIAETGIESAVGSKIEQLSRGYKQRVGLTAALIGNPKILLLDEPTSGLDPIEQEKICNLITRLGKKRTIILSTHILSEVEDVATRLVIINKGKIVYDKPKPKGAGAVERAFKKSIDV